MNPRTTTVLGAVIGLLWILAMLALWQHDRKQQPIIALKHRPSAVASGPRVTRPTVQTNPSTDLGTFNDAAIRKLIFALAEMLTRSDVRPDEVVLSFKDDAALARFLERAGKAGLTVLDRLDGLHAVRAHYSSLGQLQAELAQNSDDYADLSGNYLFAVPQIPTKEDRAAVDEVPFGNTALSFLGINGDHSQWGHGITIAVVDTGVNADATFGSGRLVALDVGYGLSPGKGADDGHGTSVASLAAGMAADAPGVASGANILSIRVTDNTGVSDSFTISRAIMLAVDNGAKVVNVSLGGYGTNLALENAIGYAIDHGVVIVAAAGNDQAAQLAWPAADPRVVSVGAVDKTGQQVSFSNSGPQLQLTAPGYGVQSAWLNGDRAYVDGTSASAPFVSGSIAAIISQNPSLKPADAVALLERTANDAGAPGRDPAYGNGVLNLGWALNASNPNYVDTAVSSHYFDAANNQMDFVVQNRSGQSVSGMTLAVSAGTTTNTYPVGNLAPGASQVIKVPVDEAQLTSAGQIRYSTTLNNPAGVTDQIPANNRKASVLTAPKK